MKTERLKKLEAELKDLQQWLKLGLVPKKDLAKHKEEIKAIQAKIEEEDERIKFLKDSGDLDELYTSRKTPSRTTYQDHPTMSDINAEHHGSNNTIAMDVETDAIGLDNNTYANEGDDETGSEDTDWEDPFSDKARWRRGIMDPDADEW